MHADFTGWLRRVVAGGSLVCCGVLMAIRLAQAEPTVTNVWQLNRAVSQATDASHFVQLEGAILWASPGQGRLVLQDSTGAVELEMDLEGEAARAGQRVRIAGHGAIIQRGAAFQIGIKGPVVDNNGVHGLIEKSGAAYLSAGRHPLRVGWFNGVEKSGLELACEGPGLPRQQIPDPALFRMRVNADGTSNWVNGLDYRYCEVAGEVLPDFSQLTAVKTGSVLNFDLRNVSHAEHVGMEFTGFLEVPQSGLYKFHLKSDDGSQLFIGARSLRLEVIGPAPMPTPIQIAIGQKLHDDEGNQWVQVEGKVTFARKQSEGLQMELSAGAARMRVEVADDSGLSVTNLLNCRVRATGFCQRAFTTDGQSVPGILLVPSGREIALIETPELISSVNANREALPLLTTAGRVHRLKREEAQRGYPVKLQGVVTCVLPEHQAFTLQDFTRGLYVQDFSTDRSVPPQIGEFLEIEGTTDPSLFAPVVNARRVSSLGAGHLPEPVRPAWDQLMNGSLDAQYVEVEGIVTAVQPEGMTLLTPGGIIRAELRVTGVKAGDLKQYENALIRVRGCLLASWDYLTHQVKLGAVRIYGADIFLDQPAPADLFSTPAKTAAELRLFDPQAGVFQRVKVSGQIVYAREPEYFMMQAGKGLRFIAKNPAKLETGDEVEVVGFPDLLSSASPVLRESLARKTGRRAPPQARRLQPDELIQAEHDATRVRVEGVLVNRRSARSEQVLEMQSGVRTFVARLKAGDDSLAAVPPGSRLELTGVYAGAGANQATGQDLATFELLLHTAADIKVLARPPWWTLERLLVIVGALACVLTVSGLWITLLHRKVEERTAQLGAQIQERQRVEHQRAMEQERARIAQDLHDELGSGITEISMLAARARSVAAPDEKRGRHLEQVGQKARALVTALDEIVWAMNPGHDSLASLVSYFALYADRFLGLANIAWRLEGPAEPPDRAVGSRHRHQLFLAFKEALTNVVRHSGATEVRLGINVEQGRLKLSIADNGRGLPSDARTEEMNGVANMKMRIEKLNGSFDIASEAKRGTTVRFDVPLN